MERVEDQFVDPVADSVEEDVLEAALEESVQAETFEDEALWSVEHSIETVHVREEVQQESVLQEVRLDDRYIYWGNVSLEWIDKAIWADRTPDLLWIELPYPTHLPADLKSVHILADSSDDIVGLKLPEHLNYWKGPIAISLTANLPSIEGYPLRELLVRQSIMNTLDTVSKKGWSQVGICEIYNMDLVVSSLYEFFSKERHHIIDRVSIELQESESAQDCFSYMMSVWEKWPNIPIPAWKENDLQRIHWTAQSIIRDLNDPEMEVRKADWKLLLQAFLNDFVEDKDLTRFVTDEVGLDANLVFHYWYKEVKDSDLDPAGELEGIDLINTMTILECWVTLVPSEEQALRLLGQMYLRIGMDDRPMCGEVLEAYKRLEAEDRNDPAVSA